MLQSKSFVRKTKRGAIVKIVKEHYLRDDLYCGIPGCSSCPDHITNLQEPRNIEGLSGHYIFPDTNIVYHQVKMFLI
jgi:exosome complex exonuclease DIS3/RRP44